MRQLVYIERLVIAALLLLLLALAPARAQMIVYQGETTPLEVEQKGYDTYKWDIYNDSTVNFAVVEGTAVADGDAEFVGDNSGAIVNVLWNKPGKYFFKVTAVDVAGCANNLKMGIVIVLEAPPTAVLAMDPDSVCIGEWATLEITFTGKAPWNFKLQMEDPLGNFTFKDYTGITDLLNPLIIPVNPVLTTRYTVIELKDARSVQKDPSNTVDLTIHPLPRSSRIYLKNP